jgi:hypothetical protein
LSYFDVKDVGRHESACQREANLRELQDRASPGRRVRGLQQSPAQTAPGLTVVPLRGGAVLATGGFVASLPVFLPVGQV